MKLSKDELGQDPIAALNRWIADARKQGLGDEPVFTLATVDEAGAPDARPVVIRTHDEEGMTFLGDNRSPKGLQLSTQPRATLVAYWPELSRHVRVKGTVDVLTDSECDEAFASRPRRSQLGYWTNEQSTEIEDRAALEKKLDAVMTHFEDQEIPRPEYWVVYRLRPDAIEFWQSGERHLHDRIVFNLMNERWIPRRLQP